MVNKIAKFLSGNLSTILGCGVIAVYQNALVFNNLALFTELALLQSEIDLMSKHDFSSSG